MNAIASFHLCTLTDEELLKKVDDLTDDIYEHGKVPTRHIPARPNEDYDLLVGELTKRFYELTDTKLNLTSKDFEELGFSECSKMFSEVSEEVYSKEIGDFEYKKNQQVIIFNRAVCLISIGDKDKHPSLNYSTLFRGKIRTKAQLQYILKMLGL